jgi:hypothetical protein
MAGLAATLNAPDSMAPLLAALTSRGPDGSVSRLDGPDGASLMIGVRAVIPSVTRVLGRETTSGAASGDPEAQRLVAAFAVDGVASVSALDAGYTSLGPSGLLGGSEAYAIILADLEQEALVLARNGNGPGLYYARYSDGWLVASEPGALIRAGVSAAPDREVVRRFIESGVCDDTEATFFSSIWRVLPGEAVVLSRDGEIRSHETTAPPRPASAVAALSHAVGVGRVGIALGPGLPGAAVLGTALARPDRLRPLPVHTATFPGLGGSASHTPAVLVPMPYGAIRHVPHTFDPHDLDLDGFLRDMGEPVPDLGLYVLWAIARTLDGDVDTLVDASRGDASCVARVSDRLLARYGVTVHCPLREVGVTGELGEAELESAAGRTLTPAVVRYALKDSARTVTAGEVLLSLRAAVAAALATSRPWTDQATNVDALRRLHSGEPIDENALLRAYLVERWLRAIESETEAPLPDPPQPEDVAVAGATWARLPVRTEAFAPGDQFAARAAWYVSTKLAELRDERSRRVALREPWFAMLSAKAVAVSQRRVRPLWEIKPRPMARLLAPLARRCLPRLGEAWTMQVAMDEAGPIRVTAAVLAYAIGAARWGSRLLPPPAAALFPPRPGAVAPADSAVVRAPARPDEAAEAFLDALRYSLSSDLVETLAGCVIFSADESGSRILGFAAGPSADAVPDRDALAARLCADNPAGHAGERTPLVLALTVPQRRWLSVEHDPTEVDVQDRDVDVTVRNAPIRARDVLKDEANPALF